MSEPQWWTADADGTVEGPHTAAALADLAAEGSVDRTTRVCAAGETTWVALTAVPALAPLVMDAGGGAAGAPTPTDEAPASVASTDEAPAIVASADHAADHTADLAADRSADPPADASASPATPSARPDPAAARPWYVATPDRVVHGPFPLSTMLEFVREGRVVASTQVSQDGDRAWRLAWMVPRFELPRS